MASLAVDEPCTARKLTAGPELCDDAGSRTMMDALEEPGSSPLQGVEEVS
jgi:hypothetical protein